MATREDVAIYLAKAMESLEGAESELANRRYNNCANRCYYACFQAAIAALLPAGVQARSAKGYWRHQTIHATFVEQLINRRRRYPASLRAVLVTNFKLRQEADYETDGISEVQAHRAVRRSREFVNAIQQVEGGTE
jgi:uncharacterized protein (UPF0332 family)